MADASEQFVCLREKAIPVPMKARVFFFPEDFAVVCLFVVVAAFFQAEIRNLLLFSSV